MDREGVEVHKHAKTELGQYPAILTSHLVNNPYVLTVGANQPRSQGERTLGTRLSANFLNSYLSVTQRYALGRETLSCVTEKGLD